MSLLEVEGLRAGYGQVQVLEGIDFGVDSRAEGRDPGAERRRARPPCCARSRAWSRTTGGSSSTGRSVVGKATAEIARRGVAHVPEGRGTFPTLTVEENLRLGAYVRSDGATVREDIERCYGWFPRLRERRGQPAGSLSGGEQQMLAVGARAHAAAPAADARRAVARAGADRHPGAVSSARRDLRRAGHDRSAGRAERRAWRSSFADHAYVLESGRIALSGEADEIKDDDEVRRSYLGVWRWSDSSRYWWTGSRPARSTPPWRWRWC